MLVSPPSEAVIEHRQPTVPSAMATPVMATHVTTPVDSTPTTTSRSHHAVTPPKARPISAAPAGEGPEPHKITDGKVHQPTDIDKASNPPTNRVSYCDRCGERFDNCHALEKHRTDRLSNGNNSACCKNQSTPPKEKLDKEKPDSKTTDVPAAGKPSNYDVKAWIEVLKSTSPSGLATTYFSWSEAYIQYDKTLGKFRYTRYGGPVDAGDPYYKTEAKVAEYLVGAAQRGCNIDMHIRSM